MGEKGKRSEKNNLYDNINACRIDSWWCCCCWVRFGGTATWSGFWNNSKKYLASPFFMPSWSFRRFSDLWAFECVSVCILVLYICAKATAFVRVPLKTAISVWQLLITWMRPRLSFSIHRFSEASLSQFVSSLGCNFIFCNAYTKHSLNCIIEIKVKQFYCSNGFGSVWFGRY